MMGSWTRRGGEGASAAVMLLHGISFCCTPKGKNPLAAFPLDAPTREFFLQTSQY